MVAAPPINAFKPAFREQYPILLMRSMRAVRRRIRRQRRRTERAGLVASSSAQRLKPHKIDIQVNIDPLKWFLRPAIDTSSSFFLNRSIHSFTVAMWTDVKNAERRQYLKERLPRDPRAGPHGMVIFVPPRAKHDKTRGGQQVQCSFPACSPSHALWCRLLSK
jgi:hypothetical protein